MTACPPMPAATPSHREPTSLLPQPAVGSPSCLRVRALGALDTARSPCPLHFLVRFLSRAGEVTGLTNWSKELLSD